MEHTRPIVLCIAGLDPSAGAGILADIKTLEMQKVYGLGVCSAITVQTESDFISLQWQPAENILQGLNKMLVHYEVKIVKIGIIENFSTLELLLNAIKAHDPEIKVIWDPVISSSTGFTFWNASSERNRLISILDKIYLITPNIHEAIALYPSDSAEQSALFLSQHSAVLLKGGHNYDEPGKDILYLNKTSEVIQNKNNSLSPKHGSGCVLSSSIAAHLALGLDISSSIKNAKNYIEQFLGSNNSLLGYHYV